MGRSPAAVSRRGGRRSIFRPGRCCASRFRRRSSAAGSSSSVSAAACCAPQPHAGARRSPGSCAGSHATCPSSRMPSCAIAIAAGAPSANACAMPARRWRVLPASSPIALLGFSMGGGIAIGVAGDPRVRGVIGLAPWVPDQIALGTLRGKRLAILHGSRDRYLPLLPGVPPEHSRRVMERAAAAGAHTSHTLIDGAMHAIAVRTPFGLIPLPHARAWSAAVAAHLRELARGG